MDASEREYFIIVLVITMWNKALSQSNAETEDGSEEERELSVRVLEQSPPIVDVWAHNFEEELWRIATLAQTYSVISFDTEFPGNFVRRQALNGLYPQRDLDYQFLWHNVEKTKLIQLGLTLTDPLGNFPAGICTWQFHLQFDVNRENSVASSIEMLRDAGIDFGRLRSDGIAERRFAEGFLSSGLILNKNIKWVVFHGCFDFGYFLRALRSEPLPKTAEEFYKSVRIYFPNIYDVKKIIGEEEEFRHDGLNSISQKIGCPRIGPNHQAGSDSLLTIKSYFRLRKILGDPHFEERANSIYGVPNVEKLPNSIVGFSSMNYYNYPMNGFPNYLGNYGFYNYPSTAFERPKPH